MRKRRKRIDLFVLLPLVLLTVWIGQPPALLSTAFAAQNGVVADAALSQPQMQQLQERLAASGLGEQDAAATVRLMATHRFSNQQMAQVGDLFRAEADRGADREALLAMRAKIHEGIAKKVTPEKILVATERVASRFRVSTQLVQSAGVRNRATFTELYADSLAAGMREQDLRQLNRALELAAARAPRQAEALQLETMRTARDMSRLSVSSQATTNLLCRALEHDYSSAEMAMLRQSIGVGSGDPESCAKLMAQAVSQGCRGKELEGLVQRERQATSGSQSGHGQGGETGSGSSAGGGSGSGSGGNSGSGGGNGSSGGGNGGGNSGGSGGSGGGNGGGGGGNGGGRS